MIDQGEAPQYTLDELLDQGVAELDGFESNKLAGTEPYVLADYLGRLSVDQRRTVLRKLNETYVSEILSEMDADDSAEVVGAMRETRAVKVIEFLDPDDAADMMGELGEEDKDRLLKLISPITARKIRNLLSYEPDTAGGVMNPHVATVKMDMSVEDAIRRIRQQKEELEEIFNVYVTDADEKLIGFVQMRQLVLSRPEDLIERIMEKDIKGVCKADVDREEVAQIMAELNHLMLPVVDSDNRLLGIVSHDDVIDILQEEATEDMQILVGAGADESIHDGIATSMRYRIPWLFFNLITASIAAYIIFAFSKEIEQLAILAVFMTVVASIGGNTGQQTLAIAIRSIALNEIHSHEGRRISMREGLKGLANGLCIGVLSGVVAWGFTKDVEIAGVVTLAMILNMTLAGLVGAFIPLALKKLSFDPAQSSSIFLTAVTDISGFLIFLWLGKEFLLS